MRSAYGKVGKASYKEIEKLAEVAEYLSLCRHGSVDEKSLTTQQPFSRATFHVASSLHRLRQQTLRGKAPPEDRHSCSAMLEGRVGLSPTLSRSKEAKSAKAARRREKSVRQHYLHRSLEQQQILDERFQQKEQRLQQIAQDRQARQLAKVGLRLANRS
jgi:hypothetical protein